jgi:hypothetical protein
MSCGCENLKKRMNLGLIKSLAAKAAKLDCCEYVVFEYNGVYDFCKSGEEKGKVITRVKASE